MKPFLYLAQTPCELPGRLAPLQSDTGDVRFVSWQARSADPRSIFYPHSSWTQGRNRLYKEIAGTDYLYYVFLDDDIDMRAPGRGRRTAWREFERFLLEYEPAVGVSHYMWHLQPAGRDATRPVQTIRFFDACLNAFHREAVHTLLPYCDLLDHYSECYSQSIVCSQAAVLYTGHVLQYNGIEVVNLEQRRPEREYLYCRADDLFLQTLRDPDDYAAFRRLTKQRLLQHPSLGEPCRKGSRSYAVAPQLMEQKFDTAHPLWARQQALAALPTSSDFFGDSADADRARAWRAEKAARLQLAAKRGSVARLLWRVRCALAWCARRSRPLAAARRIAKALQARVRQARANAREARRRRDAASVERRWARWLAARDAVHDVPDAVTMLEWVGFALGRIDVPRITMIDVGGLRDDAIRALVGAMPRQPILSIGISSPPRPEYLHYLEFAIAEISNGPEDPSIPRYRLSTLLRQHGMESETIHFLAIEGQPSNLDALCSLGRHLKDCLVVRIDVPLASRGSIEALGFRLFAAAGAATPKPDLIFVNVDLFERIVRPIPEPAD